MKGEFGIRHISPDLDGVDGLPAYVDSSCEIRCGNTPCLSNLPEPVLYARFRHGGYWPSRERALFGSWQSPKLSKVHLDSKQRYRNSKNAASTRIRRLADP